VGLHSRGYCSWIGSWIPPSSYLHPATRALDLSLQERERERERERGREGERERERKKEGGRERGRERKKARKKELARA